jgi:hypothetical protein
METVFISQHFQERNRDLIAAIEAVVGASGMQPVSGDAVGGGPLSEGVKALIANTDACIAVATASKKGNKGATHAWVHDEIVMAKTLGKRCIAVVGRGVKLQGAYSEDERIDYDPDRPLETIRKLARTLAAWRREAGRQVRVVPLPADVAEVIANNAETAVCEYRLYDGKGNRSPWRKASVVPQQGAPVVHLNGASDDCLIEIKVRVANQRWCSRAIQPFTHVTFQKELAQ